MNTHFRPLAISLLLTLPLTGCIHSYKKVYNDAERTKVSFSTEKAGMTFYEALTRVGSGNNSTESKTGIHLILIDIQTETVTGPNRLFNDAVAYCDTNKDGVITEIEAGIFAASPFVNQSK